MISTLIYSSLCSLDANSSDFEQEMEAIRTKSTQNNERMGVTGFLFYFDHRFVQIFEGEFEAVTSVYSRVRRDPRHENVRIVWFSEVAEREFADGSMDCSILFIEKNHAELGVKLKFINRFISDTSQQPIKLRDLLVSVANEMQRRRDFPKLHLMKNNIARRLKMAAGTTVAAAPYLLTNFNSDFSQAAPAPRSQLATNQGKESRLFSN